MSEYKELVDRLKCYADTADDMVYGICVNAPEAMKAAADAIEQLSTKCRQLEKERDAAVADLKQASKIPYGGCYLCTSIRTEICKECYRSDMFAEIAKNPTDHWEWRGVLEEENGTEI